MEATQPKQNEKQARIDQLVNELSDLVAFDIEARQYLDDVMFEEFGYD